MDKFYPCHSFRTDVVSSYRVVIPFWQTLSLSFVAVFYFCHSFWTDVVCSYRVVIAFQHPFSVITIGRGPILPLSLLPNQSVLSYQPVVTCCVISFWRTLSFFLIDLVCLYCPIVPLNGLFCLVFLYSFHLKGFFLVLPCSHLTDSFLWTPSFSCFSCATSHSFSAFYIPVYPASWVVLAMSWGQRHFYVHIPHSCVYNSKKIQKKSLAETSMFDDVVPYFSFGLKAKAPRVSNHWLVSAEKVSFHRVGLGDSPRARWCTWWYSVFQFGLWINYYLGYLFT